MSKSGKALLQVLQGQKPDRTPVWLMRQAGRYLPEYKKLRAEAGGFLDLCLTPKWASEITLQPIRRFDFDAAILFADILLIPNALGLKLEFREGEGPVLQTVSNQSDIAKLKYAAVKLAPVFETISLVENQLPESTALIGFCGAPWTVACYMIDGNSKNGFAKAKAWAAKKPDDLAKLIEILTDASEQYLDDQIKAGAEVIQLFDSWAGLLKADQFRRCVVGPTKELVKRLKRKHPGVPVIGFPREAGEGYRDYVRATGVDCLSVDQHVELAYAKRELQTVKPLQGNLDPALLLKGGEQMKTALAAIMKNFGPTHVVNLGHGVLPETPVEHVAGLVEFVRSFPA